MSADGTLFIAGKAGIQVLVCHVNHELRGEEAAQDEAYVEMLCHKMQVPFCIS